MKILTTKSAPLMLFLALTAYAATSTAADYAEREDFGQRLEPEGNAILHGAGRLSPSGWEDVDSYRELVFDRQPILTVAWLRLKSEPLQDFFAVLDAHLLRHAEIPIIPQIGIMLNDTELPEDHYEHEVASGRLDERLKLLGEYLIRVDRPVFLRPGFAFNGEWNNYDPSQYQTAFRRVRDVLLVSHPELASRVAFVWSFAPGGADDNFERYYPGDDAVDWWAIDVFDIFDTRRERTQKFLDAAREHSKPVMIAESTPLGLGTATDTWDKWFVPFFHFVRQNSGIKAVCYDNRDWRDYERWARWGDCRLQSNAGLAIKYYHELGKSVWRHAYSFVPRESE